MILQGWKRNVAEQYFLIDVRKVRCVKVYGNTP